MSDRLQRVSEELREILAQEIQRLKDPRLGFVTVTEVQMTRTGTAAACSCTPTPICAER